jgi:hypothetical protein
MDLLLALPTELQVVLRLLSPVQSWELTTPQLLPKETFPTSRKADEAADRSAVVVYSSTDAFPQWRRVSHSAYRLFRTLPTCNRSSDNCFSRQRLLPLPLAHPRWAASKFMGDLLISNTMVG